MTRSGYEFREGNGFNQVLKHDTFCVFKLSFLVLLQC